MVGAGLAGLAAAEELVRGGAEVTLLEARDRVGGRVHSRELANGAVVEMGAEFVLPGCTVVAETAARLGLRLLDKGMRYGRRDPVGVEVAPGGMEAAVAAIEAALAAGEGRGRSALELLSALDIDPGATEAIRSRTEVSAAAPAELVPAEELGLLARVGDEPAPSVAGGNGRLPEALAARLPEGTVRLRTAVQALEHDRDGVRALTATGELDADACVIAVPAPLAASLRFDPPLPPAHRDALGSIPYGHAAKLFVPLSEPAPHSATLAVPHRFWAWTANGADGRPAPLLSAFSGSAAALDRLEVERGPERWLALLGEVRPDLPLEPGGALLSTWDDDPFARGAYSVAIGAAEAELLREPLGRVAFAGEYLGGEMAALMEGALRSGAFAASRLLQGPMPGTASA